MLKVRRRVAFLVVTLVALAFAFAVAPTASAVEASALETVAVEATAEYPTSATCTAAAKNRHRSLGPECTVVVACPAESVGCAFNATITIESRRTIGTAQGRLRLSDPNTGTQLADFFCSAPAGVSERDAGCTFTTPTVFLPAGTEIAATCSWIGDTISVNPRVTCSASMEPLGEG